MEQIKTGEYKTDKTCNRCFSLGRTAVFKPYADIILQ